jgi:hypothetical protein
LLSLVRFGRNDYSVPTAFAHHEVTALGGTEQVCLLVGTEVVATHQRCWSREQISFDPRHWRADLTWIHRLTRAEAARVST